jgi:hypothetical protein
MSGLGRVLDHAPLGILPDRRIGVGVKQGANHLLHSSGKIPAASLGPFFRFGQLEPVVEALESVHADHPYRP